MSEAFASSAEPLQPSSLADDVRIDRRRIAKTHDVIRPHIRRTPIVEIDGRDIGLGPTRVTFKLELLQHAGSFKTRGAFANMLLRDVPDVGVVAASGGNHGAAVAYAAMKLGTRAAIFVPRVSSQAKIDRIRSYGAQLVVHGDSYAEALAESQGFARMNGALEIHAFDQDETMLGQGTLALELEEETQSVDTVLVAVGGGGLIAGIAGWYDDRAAIVGVEPEGAPTLTRALEAGAPVDAEVGSVAIDSLAPRRIGRRVFPVVRDRVRRVVLVSDAEIVAAQEKLWQILRIVAEPGGAAAFAALLSGKYAPARGEHVAVVISGGNTAVQFAPPAASPS
jgi:threonine dehydratase